MNNQITKTRIWNMPKLLIVHGIIAVLIFVGFEIENRVQEIISIGGFTLSGPVVLFAGAALIWFFVLGTLFTERLRETKWNKIIPIITNVLGWFVSALLSWLLFFVLLTSYVEISRRILGI